MAYTTGILDESITGVAAVKFTLAAFFKKGLNAEVIVTIFGEEVSPNPSLEIWVDNSLSDLPNFVTLADLISFGCTGLTTTVLPALLLFFLAAVFFSVAAFLRFFFCACTEPTAKDAKTRMSTILCK